VPAPSELKEIRKEEVERAVRILGVPGGSLVFLGFEDGTLCQNEGRVKEEVSNILSRNSPTEVYFPYEKDVSMDHRVTNRVVRDSIEELDLDAVGYKYSILQKHVHFGPRMDVFLSFFKRNMIRVDISEFLPLKEKALKQFRSQVTTISRMQQKPVVDNIERFLKREESFLRC
jgi:LmbE family N-acetylglucosaminyl deacetylase